MHGDVDNAHVYSELTLTPTHSHTHTLTHGPFISISE